MCNFPGKLVEPAVPAQSQKNELDVVVYSKVNKWLEKLPLPFLVYAVFTVGFWFTLIATSSITLDEAWKIVGTHAEILGLIMVREKIKTNNSVSGISGNTFVMVALTYVCRVVWDFYSFCTGVSIQFQHHNIIFLFGTALLALDILKSIFVTYQETYDIELDVLKAWYLIPACFTVAFFMRPQHWLDSSYMQDWFLSSIVYLDAVSLMPQVVMMAMSDGKVLVPIAKYVAATGLIKCGDVFHTLFVYEIASDVSNWASFYLWLTGRLDDVGNKLVLSWVMCILVHIVQLVLLLDFFYYFFKARLWALRVTGEISLYVDNV